MKQLETIRLEEAIFTYSVLVLYRTEYSVTIKRTEKTKNFGCFNDFNVDEVVLSKTMYTNDENLPFEIIKQYNKLMPDSYQYRITELPIECSPDIISHRKCERDKYFLTYYNDHDHFVIK